MESLDIQIPYGIDVPETLYALLNMPVLPDETIERLTYIVETYYPFTVISDYRYYVYTPGRVIPNSRLIILLVDRYSMSAAEMFAQQILNIENTLIIGQNTNGNLVASTGRTLYLPNSGIPFAAGPDLFFSTDSMWPEGVGITPDIWVIGDALAATLAMLELGTFTFPD